MEKQINQNSLFDYHHLNQTKISYLNYEHGCAKTKEIRKLTKKKTSPSNGWEKMYTYMYIQHTYSLYMNILYTYTHIHKHIEREREQMVT